MLSAICTLLCSCAMGGEQGGELIIENSENIINLSAYGVDTFNPLRTKSESAAQLMWLIYEPLFYHDEDLRPEPGLAERVVMSADRMYATVVLTDGTVWQDASPLCAEDVVYSINEIKGGDSLYKHNVAYIASAKAQEDGTVLLELYEPVMNIEGCLSFPIIKNGSSGTIDEKPDGTGAFRVSEKNASKLYLVPNEKYRASSGSVTAVNVRLMRSAISCVNAFEANELDVITSSEIDLGQKTPGGNITVRNYTSNRFTFLGFNNTLAKYEQPYLRQVIAEIIDRDKLIESALYGRGVPCAAPVNPDAWFYTQAQGPELDIRGTMSKAGYSLNGGIYTDEQGIQAEVSVLVPMENAQKIAAAELIASQLEYAGISARLEQVSFDEYKSRIDDKNYDMFLGEVIMEDNLDPGFLTESGNYFGFYSQQLSDAAYALRYCADDESLSRALLAYEQVFFENPPFVPLYYSTDGVVYTKQLSGVEQPNFYNSLAGLEKWYFRATAE